MGKKNILKQKQKTNTKPNDESNSFSSNEENEENEESLKEEEIPKTKKGREIQNEKGIVSNPSTGVVYVGHLPWGFIDSTLEKYFSQFGKITRIISPKSSKTGRSVGYAFIEFEDEETARIAAKTMNNYILFEKILKCNFVEDKSKYDRIFLKWKKKYEFKERYKAHCEKISKQKSKGEIKNMIQGLLDREEQRREKMKELGIKYEYKGFKEIVEEYKIEHLNEIKEKNKNKENKKDNDNKKEKSEKKKYKETKLEKKDEIKKKEKPKNMKYEKKEEEEEEEEKEEEEEEENQMEEEEEKEEEEKEKKEIPLYLMKIKKNCENYIEYIKNFEVKKSKKETKKEIKKEIKKENDKDKKIETVRKQRKLEEIKKKKEKKPQNKGKFNKGKK